MAGKLLMTAMGEQRCSKLIPPLHVRRRAARTEMAGNEYLVEIPVLVWGLSPDGLARRRRAAQGGQVGSGPASDSTNRGDEVAKLVREPGVLLSHDDRQHPGVRAGSVLHNDLEEGLWDPRRGTPISVGDMASRQVIQQRSWPQTRLESVRDSHCCSRTASMPR